MEDDPGRTTNADTSTDPLLLAVVAVAALAPFLDFVATNRFEALDERSVLVAGAVTTVLACGVTALVARRIGYRAAAAGAVVFLLLFFAFGLFEERLEGVAGVLAWLVVTGAGVVLAARVARSTPVARLFLLIVGGVMALGALLPFLPQGSDAATSTDTTATTAPFLTEAAHRPDVYLFVLDAYARADQLAAALDYDNEPTLDALRARGFQVGEDATSAYLFTPASIASLLQAAYPVQTAEELAQGLDRFGPVMTGQNRTVETFRTLGYEYWYAEPGVFEPMACEPGPDVHCLPVDAARPALGEAGVLIGRSTPLGLLSAFDPPRDLPDPADVTDLVLAEPGDGPRFVYAHILSPHNPFRVHADCTPRDEPIDLLGPRSGALGEAYAEQLTCLNTTLLTAIDDIVAADPDAVIAVVSDHGDWFSESFPGPDADPDVLLERFGILMALRTPDCPDLTLPEQLPGVFPTIFGCLGDTTLPVPEPRHFYVDYDGRFAELDAELNRLP